MKTKAVEIRRTDVWLMVSFPLTLISGLLLHVASHDWSSLHVGSLHWLHIVCGVVMLIFAWRHFRQHKGWFKSLLKRFSGHSPLTLLTALLFVIVALTGLVMLPMPTHVHLGLAHYQLGLVFALLAAFHWLTRLKNFRKLPKK